VAGLRLSGRSRVDLLANCPYNRTDRRHDDSKGQAARGSNLR
jgi:hypothetical protein